MKKKLLSLLIAFVLVLTLPGVTALGEAETAETDIMSFFRTEASVEGKTVPVLIDVLDEEKPKEMEFTLYFVEGGDIPYVALPDFAPLLSELMLYGEETEDIYGLYTVNSEGGDIEFPEHYFTLSRTNPFSAMVLNTADDTIEFSDLNTFTQVPGHTALVPSPAATWFRRPARRPTSPWSARPAAAAPVWCSRPARRPARFSSSPATNSSLLSKTDRSTTSTRALNRIFIFPRKRLTMTARRWWNTSTA